MRVQVVSAHGISDASVASVEANQAKLLSETGEMERARDLFERSHATSQSARDASLKANEELSKLVMNQVLRPPSQPRPHPKRFPHPKLPPDLKLHPHPQSQPWYIPISPLAPVPSLIPIAPIASPSSIQSHQFQPQPRSHPDPIPPRGIPLPNRRPLQALHARVLKLYAEFLRRQGGAEAEAEAGGMEKEVKELEGSYGFITQ